MVDVNFKLRAQHFVSLALIKRIAALPSSQPFKEINYIGTEGVDAIKKMPLVTRGRLSVQSVGDLAWNAVQLLAQNGGWDDGETVKRSRSKSKHSFLHIERTICLT